MNPRTFDSFRLFDASLEKRDCTARLLLPRNAIESKRSHITNKHPIPSQGAGFIFQKPLLGTHATDPWRILTQIVTEYPHVQIHEGHSIHGNLSESDSSSSWGFASSSSPPSKAGCKIQFQTPIAPFLTLSPSARDIGSFLSLFFLPQSPRYKR